MGNLDPMLYLYTGRRSLRGFLQNPYLLHYSGDRQARPLGSATELRAMIEQHRVDYLVWMPNLLFKEAPWLRRLYGEAVTAYPRGFVQVYEGGAGEFRVYAVQRSPEKEGDGVLGRLHWFPKR
jgi:hypothetical protein